MKAKLTLLLIICLLILLACSSAPKNYPPLDNAITILNKTKAEPGINNVASVTLFEAEERINLAKTALEANDIVGADHYIYLAKRKQQIAQELLLKHQQEQELKNLKLQQSEMIAHARRKTVQRASNQSRQAEERIKQLEQALGEYKAEETSRGTILVINDLLFVSGGANLQAESQRRLEPLVQYLIGNSKREIIIEGHTDSMGEAETNKRLSLLRANAVKEFLVMRSILPTRIETRGFGAEVPVATNTTNAGRILNRRVEIVIKTPK